MDRHEAKSQGGLKYYAEAPSPPAPRRAVTRAMANILCASDVDLENVVAVIQVLLKVGWSAKAIKIHHMDAALMAAIRLTNDERIGRC